jgi:Sigma-70 region 2
MDQREWQIERFEHRRSHLRAVAYRMLGSVSEADDALQEAWLRIRDQDPASVENVRALADDDRRPGMPEHAALAQLATRGTLRARARSGGEL